MVFRLAGLRRRSGCSSSIYIGARIGPGGRSSGSSPAAVGWLGLGRPGRRAGRCTRLGALIYAVGRPNPIPAVFGYHEVFHALVIGAAALHYAVIATILLH